MEQREGAESDKRTLKKKEENGMVPERRRNSGEGVGPGSRRRPSKREVGTVWPLLG